MLKASERSAETVEPDPTWESESPRSHSLDPVAPWSEEAHITGELTRRGNLRNPAKHGVPRFWLPLIFERDVRQYVDVAQAAEQFGFTGIALPDHVAVPR